MDINRLIHPSPLHWVSKRVPGGPGEYYKLEQKGLARMWQGPFEFHIREPHNRTGALPRLTPSIYDALYGRRIDFIEKEVEDPIQRNSKWKRIELVIQVCCLRYVVGLGNGITEQSGCGAY